MQFIEILKLIISILPLLIEAITTVENAIPGKSNGEAKLAVIKSVIETVYQSSNDISVKIDKLWPAVQSVISGLISAFNSTGLFKK